MTARILKTIVTMAAIAAIAVIAFTTNQPQSPARAANIAVTTTDDELNSDGDCSLREAITAANADAAVDGCAAGSGADVIDVPAGTYTLSIPGTGEDAAATGDLDITADLTIVGAGATTTIVDGDDIDRVVQVAPAVVEISDLTITNGTAASTGRGGGIQNFGTLTLENVVVSNNGGFNGGGIANDFSTMTLLNSTIAGNMTTGNSGAGIVNSDGTLTVANSAVTNNSTTGDSRVGGGMGIFGGTVDITNTTFSGNAATGDGGGIFVESGKKGLASVGLTNVTLTNNTADSDAVADGAGGGVFVGSGTLSIVNTIVAGNTAEDCSGPVTSVGSNIDGDGTCGLASTGDQPNTDPQLGPLADNGGPTQTHSLASTSPAIDAADDAACPADDQRGVARPIDGDDDGTATCDIGAFEFEPVQPMAPTIITVTPAGPTATIAALPATGGSDKGGGDLPLWLVAALLGAAALVTAIGVLRLRPRP